MPSHTDEIQAGADRPLRVDSPVRFAVIGPGKPYPTVILATDTGISDLVGYYSLRELGMQSLLSLETRYEPDLIGRLFSFGERSEKNVQAPIGSVDVWIADSDNGREQLYSLVIQSQAVRRGELIAPPEVTSGLENQLKSVAKAHRTSDAEAIRYAAQILTTILGLVEMRAVRQLERGQRFARIISYPLMLAVTVMMLSLLIPLLFEMIKKPIP